MIQDPALTEFEQTIEKIDNSSGYTTVTNGNKFSERLLKLIKRLLQWSNGFVSNFQNYLQWLIGFLVVQTNKSTDTQMKKQKYIQIQTQIKDGQTKIYNYRDVEIFLDMLVIRTD